MNTTPKAATVTALGTLFCLVACAGSNDRLLRQYICSNDDAASVLRAGGTEATEVAAAAVPGGVRGADTADQLTVSKVHYQTIKQIRMTNKAKQGHDRVIVNPVGTLRADLNTCVFLTSLHQQPAK